MTPVVADGCNGTQIESGYGGNDIESALAFHVVNPADEAVGGHADTHRRSTRSTKYPPASAPGPTREVAAKTAQPKATSLVKPIWAPKR